MTHDQQSARLREIDDLLAECQRHDMTGVRVSYAQLRALRDAVSELDALRKQEPEQEPVAMVVHHNPPFGVVYKVEWYTKYRDLPDGTKLYTSPVTPATSVHCDNCGCDWLDNGLNPVGCPYCKPAAVAVPDGQLAVTQAALKAALDFLGTVAGGSSWWDDVWPEHEAAMLAAAQAKEVSNGK